MNKLLIAIPTMNRASELAILMQSLRSQTFMDWDLAIVDGSITPKGENEDVRQFHTISKLINQLVLENHRVYFERQIIRGLADCRNQCLAICENEGYEYVLFIDDDVVIDKEFVELLFNETKRENFGAIGGIIPHLANPQLKRSIKHVKPLFNEAKFTKEGEPICPNCGKVIVTLPTFPLACGYCQASYIAGNAMYDYIESEVVETDHIQSGFLCKYEAVKESNAFITDKSFPAFREDTEASMRIKMSGYWIGVHTGAKAWHFATPSGGCRQDPNNYNNDVVLDDENFRIKCKRWCLKGKWKNVSDK